MSQKTTTSMNKRGKDGQGQLLSLSLSHKRGLKFVGTGVMALTLLVGGSFLISDNQPNSQVEAISVSSAVPSTGAITGGNTITIAGDFMPSTMQEMSHNLCASMAVYNGSNDEAIKVLNDPRGNGQDYQIAKLADGNCWMLNNLKLGSPTSTTPLTPDDTNIASDFTLPTVYDPGGSSDIYSDTFYGYSYKLCGAAATDLTAYCSYLNSRNLIYDICPANWRLPSGGPTGEFSYLNGMMAGDGTFSTATDSTHAVNWISSGAFKGALREMYPNYVANYYSSSSAYPEQQYGLIVYVDDNGVPSINPYGMIDLLNTAPGQIRCMLRPDATATAVTPTVTIDGVAAAVTAWNSNSITVTAPAHIAGKVDIVVTRGAETVTLADGYEYVDSKDDSYAGDGGNADAGTIPGVPNTGLLPKRPELVRP